MHRQTITVLAALAVVALTLSACGKDDTSGERSGATQQATATSARPTVTEPARTEPTRTTDTGCKVVEPAKPKEVEERRAPRLRLNPDRTYVARLRTSCGALEIRLNSDDSPKTAASFITLARDDFYDGLTFHRISSPGGRPFVVQGGDPDGTGNGDPGYTVVEPPSQDAQYRRGTVAMAKSDFEDPGTSGSQFFIVTADDARLNSDFAVLGRVTDGMETVQRIAEVPTDPATEMPVDPVVIQDIKISDF